MLNIAQYIYILYINLLFQILFVPLNDAQNFQITNFTMPNNISSAHLRKIDRNKKTYLQKGHGLHESGG